MLKDSTVSDSSSTSDIVPHSRPTLGDEEEAALLRVLRSNHPASGPEVISLEEEMASFFSHPGAIATGSGSQALLLALVSLDLRAGKRVALPAFTCSAVLHAIEWAGAEPVLIDLAEGEIAPSPAVLDSLNGPVDAVIVVHPWGHSLDTESWKEAVPVVIEDCAQSIGAFRGGTPIGSSGDASIFSFYATKMLCAGQGGMISAPDKAVIDRARDLRDYDGKREWAPRFNFSMSDLQAVLARVQWSRLSEFIDRRAAIADRYHEPLRSLGFTPILPGPEVTASWYRYLCWSPTDITDLLEFCNLHGVHCRRPVPVSLDLLLGNESLPNTEEAWNRVISIPLYPSLTDDQQNRVLSVLGAAEEERLIG
ncbi:DegT/DnrJ/EryC1/StrS family aminotransferase [Candidatus Zixiibacteriota bacterium]